jgi:hypothetical protein
MRRVIISNVVVYNAGSNVSSIISGIPGHPIEDVTLSNIKVYALGGGTLAQAALELPEKEAAYPEATMFDDTPAYAFFIRHVKALTVYDVTVSCLKEDSRAPFVLKDVNGIEFSHLKAQHLNDVPTFTLKEVQDFSVHSSYPILDKRLKIIKTGKL